jgi:hypothetical protein
MLVAATTGLGAEFRALQIEHCVGTVRLCCASNGGVWVGVEVWLHLFLRVPDGGGWSASRQGPFTGGE